MELPVLAPVLRMAIDNVIKSGKHNITNDKEFAKYMHISPTTLSNYVNGNKPISKTLVQRFKVKFGLSLYDMAVFASSPEEFLDVASSDEIDLLAQTMSREELIKEWKHLRYLAVGQTKIISNNKREL